MGTVRNNINIEGLSLEEELPTQNNGQLITYSEADNFQIPENYQEAASIYEILIEIDIKSRRLISTGLCNIIVLDGIKKYKILYIEKNEEAKAAILYMNSPYNTFLEVPKSVNHISELNIHIIDAYFHLKDSRNIYEHLIYQLDIHYDKKSVKKIKASLLEEDSLDEGLIKKLSSVSNILSEAALGNEGSVQEADNIMICYRNVEDIFN